MKALNVIKALCVTMALLALASILQGCAHRPPSDDIVTSSDEPEARHRARLRLQLATGYYERGQATVALDETKQALAIDPSFADAWNLRGLVYMDLNDAKLAEESFRKALSLGGDNPDVLHNYGWLQCQQGRYEEAGRSFAKALAQPAYANRARTLLAQGLCQIRAGQPQAAEQSLLRAYELDAANPVTAYNLAQLIYRRGDFARAQFYIQRVNNDADLSNAETLWLGVKIEHCLGNAAAREALGRQLRARYPESGELNSYERRAFDE